MLPGLTPEFLLFLLCHEHHGVTWFHWSGEMLGILADSTTSTPKVAPRPLLSLCSPSLYVACDLMALDFADFDLSQPPFPCSPGNPRIVWGHSVDCRRGLRVEQLEGQSCRAEECQKLGPSGKHRKGKSRLGGVECRCKWETRLKKVMCVAHEGRQEAEFGTCLYGSHQSSLNRTGVGKNSAGGRFMWMCACKLGMLGG